MEGNNEEEEEEGRAKQVTIAKFTSQNKSREKGTKGHKKRYKECIKLDKKNAVCCVIFLGYDIIGDKSVSIFDNIFVLCRLHGK